MIQLPTDAEPVVVIHGNCLEVLPTLPAGCVDAVVTDPPYGLDMSGSGEWAGHWSEKLDWDREISEGLVSLVGACGSSIIWGGNYYDLPPSRGWLIWDKIQVHSSGHAELAWTNLDSPVRTFRLSRVEAYSRMNKQHPTQKPVALMRWCIRQLPADANLILDPFAGSGTTGVAAIAEGRKCILIEKDAKYVEICRRRIAEAMGMGKGSLLAGVGHNSQSLFEVTA